MGKLQPLTPVSATVSLDVNIITDNNYSTTAALDFTTEKTIFQIIQDTLYEIKGVSVDMTPFTAGATITFKFYRAFAAAGASYRISGDSITKVVGTDNPIVEFNDWSHYGYTKITATSNNVNDNSVTVPFTYIKRNQIASAINLDMGIITNNSYSSTAALNFTTEKTVFEIAQDTIYELKGSSVDMTTFTNGATITFKFYRSLGAAGATYRIAGDTITKIVGTDNPVVEFADCAHYGYTKITAQSNNAGDNSVTIPFAYIKKNME